MIGGRDAKTEIDQACETSELEKTRWIRSPEPRDPPPATFESQSRALSAAERKPYRIASSGTEVEEGVV